MNQDVTTIRAASIESDEPFQIRIPSHCEGLLVEIIEFSHQWIIGHDLVIKRFFGTILYYLIIHFEYCLLVGKKSIIGVEQFRVLRRIVLPQPLLPQPTTSKCWHWECSNNKNIQLKPIKIWKSCFWEWKFSSMPWLVRMASLERAATISQTIFLCLTFVNIGPNWSSSILLPSNTTFLIHEVAFALLTQQPQVQISARPRFFLLNIA